MSQNSQLNMIFLQFKLLIEKNKIIFLIQIAIDYQIQAQFHPIILSQIHQLV